MTKTELAKMLVSLVQKKEREVNDVYVRAYLARQTAGMRQEETNRLRKNDPFDGVGGMSSYADYSKEIELAGTRLDAASANLNAYRELVDFVVNKFLDSLDTTSSISIP